MLSHGSHRLIQPFEPGSTSDYTAVVLEQLRRSARLLQSRSALPELQLVQYTSTDAEGRTHTIFTDRPPTVAAVDLPQRETSEDVAELHGSQERRRTGYALQRRAADLVPGERVALCHRLVQSASKAEIRRHNGRAYFANLQTCGSVWMCPVCAAKITEARRTQLQTLVEKHRANGGQVAMLTLTIPHGRDDVLQQRTKKTKTRARAILKTAAADGMHQVVGRVRDVDLDTGEIREYDQVLDVPNSEPVGVAVFSEEHQVVEDDGLVSRLTRAYRKFVSGRGALSYAVPGYVGYVRALEVTVGGNGWHPHLHVLLLLENELSPVQLYMLEDDLHQRWADKVRHEGLGEISRAGLKLEASRVAGLDRDPITDYLCKWGAAEEMSKLHTKKARSDGTGTKGRSPWQLLAASQDGDRQAGAAWAEYASAFKGRRQLVPSRGLWDQFGLEDLSDLQLATAQPEQHESVVILERAEWIAVRACGDRSTILDLADYGPEQVRRYVAQCVGQYQEQYGELGRVRAGDSLEEAASLSEKG